MKELMIIYLKGYYGYQNRGDELLLLGVLQFLYKKFTNSLQVDGIILSQKLTIYIESGDVIWLQDWISKNSIVVGQLSSSIIVISKYNVIQFAPWVTKVIGGGEVITDARKFPHNGWNYFFLYGLSLLFRNVLFIGGIGEPKSFFSRILWNMLLKGAREVIVREETSYERVLKYSKNVSLHRDFAYDILENEKIKELRNKKTPGSYVVINCNSHYWNNEVQKNILDFCAQYPDCRYYYFAAAMGDDSDVPYFKLLKEKITNLELYDRRKHNLTETLSFISGAKAGIATRLHVLLPLQYYKVPLVAFVYQEKISKILGLNSSAQKVH